MLKYAFLALFCTATAHAIPQNVQYQSVLGPVASTTTVTINPSGPNNRTCFTNLVVYADQDSLFRMLSGGTTTYQVQLSSGIPHTNPFGPNDPLCSVAGSTTTLKVNPATNFTINYHGYKF